MVDGIYLLTTMFITNYMFNFAFDTWKATADTNLSNECD